jgi:hypothetical protein
MQSWPETQKDFMNWEQSERKGDSPVRLPLEDDPNDPRGKLIQKIVHLDLKGMPPLISYYEKLFPLLRRLGVTGILVEYEDMFPFHGPLAPIANKRAYSRKEIGRLNHLAAASNLEVSKRLHVLILHISRKCIPT